MPDTRHRTAEDPLGIRITQHSLIFPRGTDEGYVMLIFTLENISAGPIAGLRTGMLLEWDFPFYYTAGQDTTDFDAATDCAFMFNRLDFGTGPYRGVSVLSSPGATAFRALDAQNTLYEENTGEVLLTDDMKWNYLSAGIGPPAVPLGIFGDAATFIGTGPITLNAPGDTVQVAFAFVGSEDGRARLLQHAAAAQAKYAELSATGVGDEPLRPVAFTLEQNYPNPFNPTTRIAFNLRRPAVVQLEIFNVIGQRVRTLVAEPLPAGRHTVTWDGRDARGGRVASGVYFYRLKAGDETRTRRMLLLE